MQSRLRFWKYPIFVILLLLIIAAFTLVYTLTETAKAPYDRDAISDEHVAETAQLEEEPEQIDEPFEPEISTEPEPEQEPEQEPEPPDELLEFNPNIDGFVTIHKEESDIHRGPLILVNHDHAFEIPDDLELINIVDAQTTSFRVQHNASQLAPSIIQPLDEMMEAFLAATNNRSVTIRSAFRNYESQQRILNTYTSRMGRREALRWASLPGHSEHHTGLAFDFGIVSGGTVNIFTGTGNTSWFRRNSYRHGFILRYAQNKTHITQTAHEPWHFRYVGLPHSVIMFQNNWCLEEYIEIIGEYTFEEPFEFEFNEILYEIYFTASTDVRLPLNSEFEISGNNIDGFIVTINRLDFDPDEIIEAYV